LGYGLKENLTLQCTPCPFGKLRRGPRRLPLSPPSLILSAALLHHPPPFAGELPCCQLPLTALTPPPGPPAHPAAARPTMLAFPRPATSCRRRPTLPRRAAGHQLLFQLAGAPSRFHSASRSPPRLLLLPRAVAFRFLGFFSARHRRHSSAALSAHRCQPPPPPHTRNPVLHRHHYIPLKLPD
jgi:hypothetical protein